MTMSIERSIERSIEQLIEWSTARLIERPIERLCRFIALALLGWLVPAAAEPGSELYRAHCSACHEGAVPKAPHRTFLAMLSPDRIEEALVSGSMAAQGKALTGIERHALIAYLTGAAPGQVADHAAGAYCRDGAAAFDLAASPVSLGWGRDYENSRFFPADSVDLAADDYPRLALDWAFVFPGVIQARSQPMVAWGHIYVGSADGRVYALRRESGCIAWQFQASAEVRTAIVARSAEVAGGERPLLVFGDLLANVYAVDARSGELLWRRKVDDHPSATVTGSPSIYRQQVFVPVSSLEVTSAAEPTYSCCSFRGSIVALDIASGAVQWQTHTVPQPAAPTRANRHGVMQRGPSGSPVWNSPTVDRRRGLLYFGTGSNYSSPADHTSDAIFAIAMADGSVRWIQQKTRGDAWNMGCVLADKSNCPEENGPDLDFGASVFLQRNRSGADRLIAAQKSGWVYALDPDRGGRELWRKRLGRGGIQGGIHFGFAAAGERLFIPVSDYDDPRIAQPPGSPGLYAISAARGELLWSAPAPDSCAGRRGCSPGISAAISATPDAVIAGGMDGVLRIHAAADGKLLWQFDSVRDYQGVNGLQGRGGSFGGDGPVLAGGQLIVNSGYGLYGHMPGNVLLVFSRADPADRADP